jgi:hypothetical protein
MDIMFRITFMCEDKNLARVMHDLAGQAYDLQVVPVAGSNPTVRKSSGSGLNTRMPQLKREDIIAAGGAAQMLVKVMRQQKLDSVTAPKVKEICRGLGLSTTSYSHLLNNALKLGLVRKAGKNPDGNGFLWRLTDNKGGDK